MDEILEAPCADIVGDIEDLISAQDITPKERYSSRKHIKIRPRKQVTKPSPSADNDDEKPHTENAPGTQLIFLKTWGCAHNSSDSEYMAGQLSAYGYRITQDRKLADLWLLNSCTVKNPSEDHFRNEIEAAREQGKYVVLAGCVPQGAPKATFVQGFSVIGVQQIDRVVEVVEETLKGNTVKLLGTKKSNGKKIGGASLLLPKIRKNPLIEIIAINTGCLNQCTYCKTKHARGDLGSYPPEEIVTRAKQAFEEGVVEIWLTSEDTGAYGHDIGSSLPELLWQLVDTIPDGCRLRLGMTNPPYILEHLDEMAKILAHDRVYSFLHVPVQSGSDQVLGDMKREYCVADFERVANSLKNKISNMTIATDIICGFPTETEKDFDETLVLCERHKFPSLFINQFFPRPGTPAANMVRIPADQVKRRTKRLTDLFYSYEPYDDRVGQVHQVLVTEIAHDKHHYVGHNISYEQVLLPMDRDYMGQLIEVEIVSASKFSMMGRPVVETAMKPGLAPPLESGVVSGVRTCAQEFKVDLNEQRNNRLLLLSIGITLLAICVRTFYHILF